MRKNALITAAALAVLVTACDTTTTPDSALTPTELAELSNAMIQEGLAESADTSLTSSLASTTADGLALDVVTRSTEISRTFDCPLGGEIAMVGSMERTRDTETRAGTMDMTATRTFTDCARPLRDSTVTITLNGEVTFTAHREWQAGQWHGAQEITLLGAIDWATSDGRAGTCEIDIEAGFDPETRTRNVTGSVCDEDIGGLGGWSFGVMGQGPGYRHHHRDRHGGQGGMGGMGDGS